MSDVSTEIKMTTLDCSDPRAEATFWSELLGWEVAAAEDEYAMLVPPGGGAALGFGAVPDYSRRPGPTSAAASSSTSTWAAATWRRRNDERSSWARRCPTTSPATRGGCCWIRPGTRSA